MAAMGGKLPLRRLAMIDDRQCLFVSSGRPWREMELAIRPVTVMPHLIFASGPSFEAAEAVAVAALNDKGWEFAKVLRGGEVGPEGYEGKDDVLRSAADRATANGCAIVTYATPIALKLNVRNGSKADISIVSM